MRADRFFELLWADLQNGVGLMIPALLTRISSPPIVLWTSFIRRWTSCKEAASYSPPSALTPKTRASSTVFAKPSLSCLAVRKRSAPCRAYPSATDLPIPLLAPVTSALLPESLIFHLLLVALLFSAFDDRLFTAPTCVFKCRTWICLLPEASIYTTAGNPV